MCCRYCMEESPELRPYIEAARRSPLAAAMTGKLARPLITCGEVRPTNIAPVLAPSSKSRRTAVFPMVWGFTLPGASAPLINCRAETAAQKQTWKDAWRSHRCIIPCSFYFEWEHLTRPDGKTKTGDKYMIQPRGAEVCFLAGLYRIEEFQGLRYPVFAVLTREPTPELMKLHDRMPVILGREYVDDWIDPESDPAEVAKRAVTDIAIS